MAGVRLFHKTLKDCVYLVEHPRKYKRPFLCPGCNKVHIHKTYHLKIDTHGATIVSEEIFRRLQEVGLPDLIVANQVVQPPGQVIAIAGSSLLKIVEAKKLSRLSIVRKRLLTPKYKMEVKKDG